MRLGDPKVIGRDFLSMSPMSIRNGFEFEAFEVVLIDGTDLSVKLVFCLKQDLECIKDTGREIGVMWENSLKNGRPCSCTQV